jgi:hypothetical protein
MRHPHNLGGMGLRVHIDSTWGVSFIQWDVVVAELKANGLKTFTELTGISCHYGAPNSDTRQLG